MKCPVCNADNIPQNSKFCNMCGGNLIDAAQKSKNALEHRDTTTIGEQNCGLGGALFSSISEKIGQIELFYRER